MMLSDIRIHSSDLFTYDKNTSTFICESSDLGPRLESRIYDDACDIGFYIQSAKTGRKKLFFHVDAQLDGEGDLISMVYRSEDGLTCQIFND